MSGPGGIMPDGRTFEAYVDDYRGMLDQIASGIRPGDDELTKAPLISGWIVDEVDYGSGMRHKHIFGIFEGHPFIAEGSYGRTSPLLQLDRGLEWARCRSRVYRLRDALTKSKILASE